MITSDNHPVGTTGGDTSQEHVWTARVITLFPETFPGVLSASLIGNALTRGQWKLDVVDLRQFGIGRHRAVDDTPTGGGTGMIIRADVVAAALESGTCLPVSAPLCCLTPRGQCFDQAMAQELASGAGVTLLCGRFEGIDQRVIDAFAMREVSLGDFVLSGGEAAAQAMIEASVRLLPGVLGNDASTVEESFTTGLLEYPHYTRPVEWQGHRVPSILLSGNHGAVARWRHEQGIKVTRTRRPDLWRAWCTQSGKQE